MSQFQIVYDYINEVCYLKVRLTASWKKYINQGQPAHIAQGDLGRNLSFFPDGTLCVCSKTRVSQDSVSYFFIKTNRISYPMQ